MNALAAIAAARHAGVPPATAIAALSVFRNVRRRMEVRGNIGGVTVYDDFAHHPTAIATTIAGLRATVGDARIVAVLEPRSNTMKMGSIKDALATSLAGADVVFCYTGGLEWDAHEALNPLGAKLQCFDDIDRLAQAITRTSRSGDQVLVMSNGSFGNVHEKILTGLDTL
jgi:UDP-N-acetylmuramate: L-alanyl-gamma-D-glutamyl-meso-diaminopimelate ligase